MPASPAPSSETTAPDRFEAFRDLAARFPDEVVTRAEVRDLVLPDGAGTLALITLDNHAGPRRPTTLGPNTLIGLGEVLTGQAARARAGEIAALAVTGKPGFLVAGADLGSITELTEPTDGALLARLGHEVYDLLTEFPVPSFAFINGLALGGGLELALAAQYRTVSSAATGLGLPEAFIGLVPGWGGVWKTPRITGPRDAVTLMLANPLHNNRSIDGRTAYSIGLADALFDPSEDPTDPTGFLDASLAWAAGVVTGDADTLAALESQRDRDRSDAAWDEAIAEGRRIVAARTGGHVPAPAAVLELFEAGRHRSRAESAAAECEALARLTQTPEFHRTVYAFLDVVQKRSKRPAGAPDVSLARPVRKVGVVGAGLMAGQLALLFAQRLGVPVVMTDIDQARVDRGLAHVRSQVQRLVSRGRLSAGSGTELAGLITGSVSKDVYADADFVIEAVFEEMGVKKQVLAELEAIVSADCILATNTSSLSVTGMAADLDHPERLVGFHFFNPVAAMPLLEIVRGPATTDGVLATAFGTARTLGKTAVLVQDAPAFVVNRVLLRMMGEVQASFDEGTPAGTADHALDSLALPMTPFTLLAMVGIPVAQHVTESLNAAFGDARFPVSANLQRLIDAGKTALWAKDLTGDRIEAESGGASGETIPAGTAALLNQGDSPQTGEELLVRVQDALAEEIGLMLADGVVADARDIDLCMILGAGWPMHLGGITPYLDDVGASQRVNGARFHG
ncbi:3-hydroxyacyl-CoA dehydrogenase NAD-binding domain-containing protein [Citricoccus sp.]|uniref:3-hydroxyacyl-CoA dehydrogenase NAD-binding domain-containing protein n=1 Tax=Citricoccus sp. TaxID=1978372 RepID=UPI00262A4A6C|nr:3-hydroxyacyl-CoA dehydrogenase NAD-binding domain-containing protein [Citricoccus sp.]HRO30203.1 3-hydroxyacyl-CoA dehydrogenase NAD-binding domain-containing protein [Citricoccus sp.]HRO94260.1 3-hydroxyacyl-CoA dehydrogenase NAD-binding domain-containing protein [Citricoccus sp.]